MTAMQLVRLSWEQNTKSQETRQSNHVGVDRRGEIPIMDAYESIRALPGARMFEIDGLLFAQFSCPSQETVVFWAHTDHLVHFLSGKFTWMTCTGTRSAEGGQTVFFKKGAYLLPERLSESVCLEFFFIPDAFVKETVIELAADLPPTVAAVDSKDLTIRVNHDVALSAFFHAMGMYFAGDEKPAEALLKLKLKELLTSILLGRSNLELSSYLQSIAACDRPSIAAIMENNFWHNLSINAFAQMCHRSLSSFKREFRAQLSTSPGKWLLERRLKHSISLLQATDKNVTEIAFDCGFKDLSHFSKSFKEEFGQSPSTYRDAHQKRK